ncbi:MAG: DUF3570 domain-containing protein [Chlorobiales bacterium]|nr:DUF3570 domain-containing protein [Chlorobiales bacterium]
MLTFLLTLKIVVGQELPEDEVQVNFNGYFDNADVNIVYPSLTMSKKVGENTSVRALYQIDMVSAASMKSSFEGVMRSNAAKLVDGISSASAKNTKADAVSSASKLSPSLTDPDDVRHEFVAGVNQVFGYTTVSVNGIYSTEHDYDSKTLALSVSQPFNQKNTVVQLGIVRSWDNIFPDIQQMRATSWEKSKDVFSISSGITQVLSPSLIAQLNLSYSNYSGFLSDPYQVVRVVSGNTVNLYNTYHPDNRGRKAIGLRLNYALFELTSLQLGYRYYWDDWDISSHTISLYVQQYFADKAITLGVGIRRYDQTAAYFFKPTYDMAWINAGNYFTVDSRLNSGYSYEYELSLKFAGSLFKDTPVIGYVFQGDRSQLILGMNFYQRHNDSPDWFIGYKDLYAYIFTLGFRIPL